MFTTPRKSYRGSNGRKSRTPSSTSKVRLDGFFDNGQWFCNCEPRLPGIRLQVKKNNKNKGRWFYTCQKDRKEQCGFFIFEDSAQMREKGTLMTTPGPADDASPSVAATLPSLVPVRRTLFGESQQARPRGQSFSAELSTDDELDMASLASEVSRQRRGSTINSQDGYRPQQQHHAVPVQSYNTAITPPAKRKLGVLQEDGDAGFDVDFDSDEERQLMQLADASAEKFRQSQAAESSVARGDSFTTPSARRTRNAPGDLPTPLTRNSLPIASEQREATAKRQRTEVAAAATPATTPTPARSTGTGHDGSSGIFGGDDYDITEEVMGLLGEGPAVTDAARHGIRDALNRYALRVRGIERGREMARATVKAKDGRIAELQARVAALENERRVNKERIKALNTGLKSLYGEDL